MVKEDNFIFNGIPPPPPPFDFSILLIDHVVYGSQESLITFGYNGDSASDNKSVSLSFEPADLDFQFFDMNLWQNVGNTLTTTLDDSYNYSVKCESNNDIYPKHVKVIAVSNGLQREDTLFVEQPNYVLAYFEKDNLSPGDTVNIIIKEIDSHNGWESNYPDTTHFEVGIKEGCSLGNILSSTGDTAKYFSHIRQPLRFIVANSLIAVEDSVVLRVGAPVIESNGPPIFSAKESDKTKKNIALPTQKAKTTISKRNKKVADNNYCAIGKLYLRQLGFPGWQS